MRILPSDYRLLIHALHELLKWQAQFLAREDVIDRERFEAMEDVERIKQLIRHFSNCF